MKRSVKRSVKRSFKQKSWQGASRIVFDIGNGYVLKLAKSPIGVRSNRREVKLYQSAPFRLTKYLGRITEYHSGYAWLIMKKYRQKFLQSPKNRQRLSKVRSIFYRHGIYPMDTIKNGKPKHQNLRIKRNGKIAIIDYGHFRYHR